MEKHEADDNFNRLKLFIWSLNVEFMQMDALLWIILKPRYINTIFLLIKMKAKSA